MTPTAVIPASTSLLAQLVNPAARALALSVIVGFGLAAFRVKNTSLRLFTWTAVLYAALAMPLLQQMLPPLPIPTPAFLQNALLQHPEGAPSKLRLGGVFPGRHQPEQSIQKEEVATNRVVAATAGKPSITQTEDAMPKLAPASGMTTARKQTPVAMRSPAASPWFQSTTPWNAIATAIYLAGAMILLLRFFIGLTFARRLKQASQTIAEPRLASRLASHARAAGLTCIPRAAESELISVPLTMGALRSTILLPTAWRDWDNAKLDAVVAHEVSHVARRDALTQRLSLLHRAIFWFSPLSWWLDRNLADLAEQASDEAALSCGADRKHYARILLGFFAALHAAPGRVWWQGVSMAKAGQAEHRVEKILAWKGSVAMRLQKSIAVIIVALAVPVVYLAASAHPAHHVSLGSVQLAQDQTPPPPPASASTPNAQPSVTPAPASAPTSQVTAAPEPPPQRDPALAPATIRGTIRGGVSGIPIPSLAPVAGVAAGVVAPVAPLAPMTPLAPITSAMPLIAHSQSGNSGAASGHGFSYAYGYDDEQRFVIVSGKTDSLTMSGSAEDARHVEKLRKNIPGDFIWFQRDEKSYVIRDQATIDRARKLWAPQEELGKKQEALGKQQEALGKQQEALGARMEQIRVNVPDLTAELEKLKAELKQLSSGATTEQVGHIQSEIGELQSKIGEVQSHAGDQQGKLGEEMGALGEKQGKLGEQQGKLGEQQAKLAEQATREMKQLLDEAITKGIAQPET
jgi:beta-lactamase regulating signal transducer with metallopeptidase domain